MGTRSYFYGWVVVATAALGLFLGSFPIVVASFGVFFNSYIQEFHATRAAISLAFTIQNFVAALLSLVLGRLCDRIGARKVILPGLVLVGVVLLSSKAVGSQLWQLYLFYSVLGFLGGATTSVPYAVVVSRWFNRRRGLALGLMMVGIGAGAIVMPSLAQRLISNFGWRNAFALIGCAMLAIPIPIVAALLKDAPEQMGLLPDGDRQAETRISTGKQGATWQEIRQSRTFWLMIAAFALVAASVHACIIHLPALFADRGASREAAALASSVVGMALLVGRIGSGYFLDRYFGRNVAIFIFAHSAVGVALLWTRSTGVPALLGAFLVGLGFGAEVDIIAYLMGRYFGLRALGTSFGFAFGAFVLGGGLGPLLMGIGFDRTGSYQTPIAGFFALSLLATALISRLGPYRYGAAQNGTHETAARRAAEV